MQGQHTCVSSASPTFYKQFIIHSLLYVHCFEIKPQPSMQVSLFSLAACVPLWATLLTHLAGLRGRCIFKSFARTRLPSKRGLGCPLPLTASFGVGSKNPCTHGRVSPACCLELSLHTAFQMHSSARAPTQWRDRVRADGLCSEGRRRVGAGGVVACFHGRRGRYRWAVEDVSQTPPPPPRLRNRSLPAR